MKKAFYSIILILMISLVGCSNNEQQTENQPSSQEETVQAEETTTLSIENLAAEDVVATIGEHQITGEDLSYELKRLDLIYLLQGANKQEASPQVAIQELIRNHMIHHIAQEQQITADAEEQTKRAHAVRTDVEGIEGYEKLMADMDEEMFWDQEENRYEIIIEAEKLLNLLMEEVKKEHPDYTEQALRFDAQEDLDEWIQEKMAEVEIDIK